MCPLSHCCVTKFKAKTRAAVRNIGLRPHFPASKRETWRSAVKKRYIWGRWLVYLRLLGSELNWFQSHFRDVGRHFSLSRLQECWLSCQGEPWAREWKIPRSMKEAHNKCVSGTKSGFCKAIPNNTKPGFPYITHSRYFASPEGFPYSGDVWFDSGDVVLTREM